MEEVFNKEDEIINKHRIGLCYFLSWFINLRWIASASSIILTIIVNFLYPDSFPYFYLYLIELSIGAYNIFFYFRIRRRINCFARNGDEECQGCNFYLVNWQITLDLIALFWILHFSGGIENPFVLFFLFHIVLSAILLEPEIRAILQSVFAVLLIFLLSFVEKFEILPHYHISSIFPGWEPLNSWYFAFGFPMIMLLVSGILLYFILFINRELRRRRLEIIKLAKFLEEKNHKLQKIDEMRRNLLQTASHDLKAPIAAVSSYLMNLRSGYLGKLSETQLKVIDRCLFRLRGLQNFISDILSYSSIEKGEMKADMKPTDIKKILLDVIEFYKHEASNKNITLKINVQEDLPTIMASPPRMQQVFENLMSNAIKYTPKGGIVEVEAKTVEEEYSEGRKEKFVLFKFKDTGIGMTEEDLKHIFSGFYRSKLARQKGIKGTGLGLSIVKLIVSIHGGSIWAQSQPGKGSTFYVKIPVSGQGKK